MICRCYKYRFFEFHFFADFSCISCIFNCIPAFILKYNFITHELTNWFIHRINNQDENPILTESRRVEHTDLLATELSDFLNNIHSDQAFLSLRDSGFEAFLLADRILEKVMKTLVRCT